MAQNTNSQTTEVTQVVHIMVMALIMKMAKAGSVWTLAGSMLLIVVKVRTWARKIVTVNDIFSVQSTGMSKICGKN